MGCLFGSRGGWGVGGVALVSYAVIVGGKADGCFLQWNCGGEQWRSCP